MRSKILYFLPFCLLFSCSEESIKEKGINPPPPLPPQKQTITISTRSAGDGRNDLLGYGYNCLYALADNYKGATNLVIDIDRYINGVGIDPKTKNDVKVPKGKIEVSLAHGDFSQYELYGFSLNDFYKKRSGGLTINSGKYIPWGKIEFTREFDNEISEKATNSFYRVDACINTKRLFFNTFNKKRLKYFLTEDFLFALDNYSAAEIIDDYGTHVLTDIFVGGKMSILATAIEEDKTKNDLVTLTGNILEIIKGNTTEKIKVTNNIKDLSLKIIQHGGAVPIRTQLIKTDKGEIDTKSVSWSEWASSVDIQHSTLIKSDLSHLIPIWEFIEDESKKEEVIQEIRKRSLANSRKNPVQIIKFESFDKKNNRENAIQYTLTPKEVTMGERITITISSHFDSTVRERGKQYPDDYFSINRILKTENCKIISQEVEHTPNNSTRRGLKKRPEKIDIIYQLEVTDYYTPIIYFEQKSFIYSTVRGPKLEDLIFKN
jgi:hypothetical protein